MSVDSEIDMFPPVVLIIRTTRKLSYILFIRTDRGEIFIFGLKNVKKI